MASYSLRRAITEECFIGNTMLSKRSQTRKTTHTVGFHFYEAKIGDKKPIVLTQAWGKTMNAFVLRLTMAKVMKC